MIRAGGLGGSGRVARLAGTGTISHPEFTRACETPEVESFNGPVRVTSCFKRGEYGSVTEAQVPDLADGVQREVEGLRRCSETVRSLRPRRRYSIRDAYHAGPSYVVGAQALQRGVALPADALYSQPKRNRVSRLLLGAMQFGYISLCLS